MANIGTVLCNSFSFSSFLQAFVYLSDCKIPFCLSTESFDISGWYCYIFDHASGCNENKNDECTSWNIQGEKFKIHL